MSTQGGCPDQPRIWSWATTSAEVVERRSHASRLVGQVLTAVRYVNIDYEGMGRPGRPPGPRLITEAVERRQPTWKYPGVDCLDFGVQFETSEGRVFSVTWDPPGEIEGIGLRELPLLGTAVSQDADVAVWDVSHESGWCDLLGEQVDDVTLEYRAWSETSGGFWCPGMLLRIGDRTVVLALAEAKVGGGLAPSADNVAVLFDHQSVPRWDGTDDAPRLSSDGNAAKLPRSL